MSLTWQKNQIHEVQRTYVHTARTGYGFKENKNGLVFNLASIHLSNKEIGRGMMGGGERERDVKQNDTK